MNYVRLLVKIQNNTALLYTSTFIFENSYSYRQILKVNRFDSGICHASIGSIDLDNVYGEEKCIMEI